MYTSPKNIETGLYPPKTVKMVCTPLTKRAPPLDLFDTLLINFKKFGPK